MLVLLHLCCLVETKEFVLVLVVLSILNVWAAQLLFVGRLVTRVMDCKFLYWLCVSVNFVTQVLHTSQSLVCVTSVE